ncbi:S-adenosylmethionine synthase [Mobiluncus curtisii]|uniref:S-adenosylmethionine synthase n=1 Tax=Mobiluncus curtisii TaxID=2051 RepID=A0A2X3BRS7_9ACTO|nr:S-adenosylmethionine synthase [Mobiluncus curtisii]
MTKVLSAEAVCIGHPDKLCDLIADQILDEILYADPNARVAVEVMATGDALLSLVKSALMLVWTCVIAYAQP